VKFEMGTKEAEVSNKPRISSPRHREEGIS